MSLDAVQSHDILSSIIRAKTVSLENVLMLRRQIWPDRQISRGEAEMLFRIDAALEETCPEWTDLFVESVTSYLVDAAHPVGYVADAEAAWLEQWIIQDGYVNGASELELLIRVLERAEHVPHRLQILALDTIKTAILTGDWKMLHNRRLEKGELGDPEVSLLRRVLYSSAGAQSESTGTDEAEVIFMLDEATSDASNCPAWTCLFVNVMSNYLLCQEHYLPPSRQQMKELDAWLNRPYSKIDGFLRETLRDKQTPKKDTITAAFSNTERGEKSAAAYYHPTMHEQTKGTEAEWIIQHLCRDDQLTPNETALLVFLREGKFQIDARLKSIISRV